MKRKQTLFLSLLSLILILACVVPGAGGQSDPVIPTDAPGKFETAIAGTFSAAASMTSAAASPTPSPTITPTATPTSKVIEGTDSTLIKKPDGTTQFVDKVAGYSIVVPANWVAFRVNQQEYYEAWTMPAMLEPNRQQFLNTFKTKDPNEFRLAALDVRDERIVNNTLTSLIFGWLPEEDVSLDSDADIKKLSEQYPSSEDFMPSVLSASVTTLSSGMKVGVIEWEIKQTNLSGGTTILYQKQAIFPKQGGGSTTIWVSTDESLKEAILPEFDAMLETIVVH